MLCLHLDCQIFYMSRVALLFLFCSLINFVVVSQNIALIDSLQSSLNEASDVRKTKILTKLAWEYRESQPDSSIAYCDLVIDIKRKLGKPNLSEAYTFKGIAYSYKGDYIKSYDNLVLAKNNALESNDSTQYAHIINTLGRLYMEHGDYRQSFKYYNLANEIFHKRNDLKGLSYTYRSQSELYQAQKKYEKALSMSNKALDLRKQLGDERGQISVLIDIAQIYRQSKIYDKAYIYFAQARKKAQSINDNINVANAEFGIAEIFFRQNQYSESLQFANKALNNLGDYENFELESNINLLIGKNHYARKEYNKAKELFQNILIDAEESRYLNLKRDAYQYLYQICENKGNINCAYSNYKAFRLASDSLNTEEIAMDIQKLESRLAIEERVSENKLLKANLKSEKALLDRQRFYNIALIVAIISITIILLNFYLLSRKSKKANLALSIKNDEISKQREEIEFQNDEIQSNNRKLLKQNKQLTELNKEKDTLTNIVAHDLKTPLASIQGLADLLLYTQLDKDQKLYVDMQKRSTQSGLDIIRDLLEINSIDVDKSDIELSTICVESLLLISKSLFESEANTKIISIEVEVEKEGMQINSDKKYLSRILDNLISNAIKFSDKESRIVLKAGVLDNSRQFISVKDFGQGFSKDDKQNLYKKFTKLSAQPTNGESSNGLGLALVKGLVTRIGADIELKSEQGIGSEFTVLFP